MKLGVLALDYDGTIAADGVLDDGARTAIAAARSRGVVVILVTGRILGDLRSLLGDLSMFDAVVAENGAVLAFPASGRSSLLSPPPSRAFLDALARRGLSARTGGCVVELDAEACHDVLDLVRELELPLTLHFNRSRLMVLPQAISKATGLRAALRTLRLSSHNAIAIGDAENDHEMLAACEIGAAVAWGSDALQATADAVVEGTGPHAVARYLREVTTVERIMPPAPTRHRLELGRDGKGAVVSLGVRGRNVLVAGDACSGKSWVAGLLCEQLIVQGYSTCVLDAEGDYLELEALPGVSVLGGNDPVPTVHELERELRHADVSIVVDLTRLPRAAKREYVHQALRHLNGLRRRTGLPHRVVVDEAHYFLHDHDQSSLLDPVLGGLTLITYRVSDLDPAVLSSAEVVVVTRETDAAEVALLHRSFAGTGPAEQWAQVLGNLEIDEAALLPVSEEAAGRLRRFRVAPRLTAHVRHRHKYLDEPVRDDLAFRFVQRDGSPGPVARSLQDMVRVLAQVAPEHWLRHVRQGDLSRWVADVLRDDVLAARLQGIERGSAAMPELRLRDALINAVRERYSVASDLAP